jgi:response regulator RpfG family c-di-GMP phosphodiesterase
MSDPIKHTMLLVDDEPGITRSLQRLFKSIDANIFTASSGQEALILLENTPVSLIISDQRMPGMTGVELLAKSRQIRPDAIRILLTGYADIESTMLAINSGAIKYYIAKPWEDDLLVSRVMESLELFDMTTDNKKLNEITHRQNEELRKFNRTLEERVEKQTSEIKSQHEELSRSFMETIKAFSTILEIRLKDVGSHSQRVAALIKKLLKTMNLEKKEYQDIVVAAFLHDIGKVSYPDALLKKADGTYTRSEMEIVTKHPILGQSCVIGINGFEEIALIIRHHHENFDGGGYPDFLRGKAIPPGARLIRIANAFDHHAFSKGYPDKKMLNDAAAHLVRESGVLFDPEYVKQFIDLDIARQYYHHELAETIVLKTADLENGMVLAENIYSNSGMFVLPKGARLSSDMIARLIKIDKFDHISRGITVYKMNKTEKEAYEPVQNSIG